jgi:GYF domain 2
MRESSNRARYFVRFSDGQVQGPITSREVQEMASAGVLTREDGISNRAEGPWRRAGEIPNLSWIREKSEDLGSASSARRDKTIKRASESLQLPTSKNLERTVGYAPEPPERLAGIEGALRFGSPQDVLEAYREGAGRWCWPYEGQHKLGLLFNYFTRALVLFQTAKWRREALWKLSFGISVTDQINSDERKTIYSLFTDFDFSSENIILVAGLFQAWELGEESNNRSMLGRTVLCITPHRLALRKRPWVETHEGEDRSAHELTASTWSTNLVDIESFVAEWAPDRNGELKLWINDEVIGVIGRPRSRNHLFPFGTQKDSEILTEAVRLAVLAAKRSKFG